MDSDFLDCFIKRTKNKYPLLAKKGYCWVRNFTKETGEFQDQWKAYRALNLMGKKWQEQKGLIIVGFKKCESLPSFFVDGKKDENSYPVFFEVGNKEILDKLGYELPNKVTWAARGMTRTDKEITRFDLLDLSDD
jgi:hypothetical protein